MHTRPPPAIAAEGELDRERGERKDRQQLVPPHLPRLRPARAAPRARVRDHPNEQVNVLADETVVTIDDYKSLSVAGRKAKGWSSRTVDKGHQAELEALGDALRAGGAWPISLEEQVRGTRISFVEQQLRG